MDCAVSTLPPKPRVESSNLSAPAKKDATQPGGVLFGNRCSQEDSKRAPNVASVSDAGFGSKQSGGLFAQREENLSASAISRGTRWIAPRLQLQRSINRAIR